MALPSGSDLNKNSQTPSDLVVKIQPLDIAGFIL
jgi:hypothetical protein